MDKQRIPTKGRKFGSSHWQQARDPWRNVQISSVSEEEPSSSEIIGKVRDIFQNLDENKRGFVTRADMQKLEVDLPWSVEELEYFFDGLDSDCNGYLTMEEFTTGLRHFLSSQSMTRERRKRKTALTRSSVIPSLKEADNEEQKCFETFINQLGADNIFEDQSEIWEIWVQLRQDEPHLLGNLKEFLAKMTHLIKEAKHAKEKLQLILKIRVADHNKEVQQLYEEMEQQIDWEKQKLQHESATRSQFHSMEIQEVLDARETEIRDFLAVQKELETQFLSLKEKQHVASSKNQLLKQSNVALENQLQQTLHQLQETQRRLDDMKNRVSQIQREEGRDRSLEDVSCKTPQSLQDPLNEHEMVYSELEKSFEYSSSEHAVDSSAQQVPDDVASITKAESESRSRVISIEEDPVEETFEQYFLPETLGQSSLLRELDDAIAALDKVSESHNQQTDGLGFQRQEYFHKIRPNGNSQQRVMQEETAQCEALLANCGPMKGISETLTSQNISQREVILKEEATCMQASALEMKKNTIAESKAEVKTLEQMQRGSLAPELLSPAHSELATQISAYKAGAIQEDLLLSKQAVQPEPHKQVLKCRDVIQPPSDSEQGMVKKKSPEMKTRDKNIPETQQPPVKDVSPAHFPVTIALPVEYEPEPSFPHHNQLDSMPESQAQTTEGIKVPLSEDRRDRQADMFEHEKSQVIRGKMNEETSDKPQRQANVGVKEVSKSTRDVCPRPDYLYNVLFVGDSNVGKTSFLYRLKDNSFNANTNATVGMDYCITKVLVDNKCFALRLWDTAGQERYHSITKQFFRKADAVVLMYDITSEYSFADVLYWIDCIQEGAGTGVIVLLLGNKTDCTAERGVSTEDGAYLAKEYGLSFYECSAASGHNVFESMVTLVRLLKAHEDKLKLEALQLPAPPKKKKSCCS